MKLVQILESLEAVPKKGYNKHQDYYYTREVDVLEVLKKELVSKKIILLTSSKLAAISQKTKESKDGSKITEFVTSVETTHVFVDAETGHELSITSVGSGYDSTDKGAAKAITSAVKYALLKTFMISDEGADIENDGETKMAPVQSSKFSSKPTLEAQPVKSGDSNAVQEQTAAPKTTPVQTRTLSFGKRPTLQKPEPNFPQ
jgi:hypothetical protein